MTRIIENHSICKLLYNSGQAKVRLSGVYRLYLGKRKGMDTWIVDRDTVIRTLYPEFIMGGNDQRYRFNPLNEIWLDSDMGVEELEYTIAHEIAEQELIAGLGWSYDRAHTQGGLAIEKRLRQANAIRVAAKRCCVKQLAPRAGSASASGRLENPVCLSCMYRAYAGTRVGVSAWIVDGPKVRKELDPNFCYRAHDLTAPFSIPANEIWLDSAMSVTEAYYSLRRARRERRLLQDGVDYDEAYDTAMIEEFEERQRQQRLAQAHEAALDPVSLGTRSKGAKRK